MRLDELAGKIEADVDGDGSAEVSACATLDEAVPGQLSFLSNPKYADRLPQTRASAVVVGRDIDVGERLAKREGEGGDLPPLQFLRAENPYASFQRAVVALHGFRRHPFEGVHPKAHVDPSATLGVGTVVYPFAFVGPGATLGRDCILYPGACVYDDCVLGDRVILHANAVIGADGFGYASAPSPEHGGAVAHHKIPHVGNVVLEDDVEVGAGTTIARAALGPTVVGRGTKLDAQVVIAHGVRLGEHCLLVSQVGVSGSTTVGHHAVFAGQAGIIGHLKIGDNVTVTAQSGVMNDLAGGDGGAIYFGSPAMPVRHARRVYALFKQLPDLLERLRRVERAVGPADTQGRADPNGS